MRRAGPTRRAGGTSSSGPVPVDECPDVRGLDEAREREKRHEETAALFEAGEGREGGERRQDVAARAIERSRGEDDGDGQGDVERLGSPPLPKKNRREDEEEEKVDPL